MTSCHLCWFNLLLLNKSIVVSLRWKVCLIMWTENTFTYISIAGCNLQRIVDRMLMLIKRLIACLSVSIMSYEECFEGLYVYFVYGLLNIFCWRDWQNGHNIYTVFESHLPSVSCQAWLLILRVLIAMVGCTL
jgi:hypothetical protein